MASYSYSEQDRLAFLAFKAIRALQIDVPVLKVEEDGGLLRLHLYGGEVVEYPTSPAPDSALVLDGPAKQTPLASVSSKKPSRRKES